MLKRLSLGLFLMTFALPSTLFAAAVTFSVGGDTTAASIQGTVDAFRAALGNPNNANAPGPLPTGRREINWDGGGTATTPAPTLFEGFENIRGAEFTTPGGTGFVQAPPTGGAQGGLATFFNNATYGTIFSTFSTARLFAPVGSNLTDVGFSIPGTNGGVAATVRGFGAVFTDVDLANSTTLTFFNAANVLLGTFTVPVATVSSGGLSFLGIVFNAGETVARVRIQSGNAALGPNDGGAVDVVSMDDFLYSEPAAVPEPATMWLLGAAGVMAAARRLRRRA